MNIQTSAVQQTAASIEEISAMIQRSSDNAKDSIEVSRSTSEKAQAGRIVASEVVKQLLVALKLLIGSFQKLSQSFQKLAVK